MSSDVSFDFVFVVEIVTGCNKDRTLVLRTYFISSNVCFGLVGREVVAFNNRYI